MMCVCVCAHRYTVLLYLCICVHRLVDLFWGLLSPHSVPEPLGMGTFSFPISSPFSPFHPWVPGTPQYWEPVPASLSISEPWQQLVPPFSPLPFLSHK